MIEVKIHIPVRANDGAVFTDSHHEAYESQLLQLFGGFTLQPLPYAGGWKDADGTVYKDETRVYLVFLGSIVNGNDVATAVDLAKTHYAQLAIAIRYFGLAEII